MVNRYVVVVPRKRWNRLLSILLSLSVLLMGCASLPSDAAVERHFYQHKAEFEELVPLIESAFQGVGSLYSFDGYVEYIGAQPKYIRLMEAVGASRSPIGTSSYYSSEAERHILSPYPESISFVLDDISFPSAAGIFGEDKGIIFFYTTPSFGETRILVSDTDKAEVFDTDSLVFYRHIEGNWYVYRNIED